MCVNYTTVLCKSYAAENAPDCVCVSQHNTPHTPIARHTLSSVRLTQYDMLPQHRVNIRKLISECFYKYDFSKEQCSSLKMVLGSKHVGAILNVLMLKYFMYVH